MGYKPRPTYSSLTTLIVGAICAFGLLAVIFTLSYVIGAVLPVGNMTPYGYEWVARTLVGFGVVAISAFIIPIFWMCGEFVLDAWQDHK